MDVMLIFDVVIAIFGVYMIGAALKMKKTGKISSAVITAEEIARCRKTKEFIAFISFTWVTRLTILFRIY